MEWDRGRIGGRRGEGGSSGLTDMTRGSAPPRCPQFRPSVVHNPRGLEIATTTLPITSISLMRSGRGLLMRITFKWTSPPSLFSPLFPIVSIHPFLRLTVLFVSSPSFMLTADISPWWHYLTSSGTWPSRRSKESWSSSWDTKTHIIIFIKIIWNNSKTWTNLMQLSLIKLSVKPIMI